MTVVYHVNISNGSQNFKVSRTASCFGGLASGNFANRRGYQFLGEDGQRDFSPPHWAIELMENCQFDEVVYEVFPSLSRSRDDGRSLGGTFYPQPIAKQRIRNFLTDLLDIQKSIPWMGIISVDLKEMLVKVDTNHPADQVFQCLSVVRNIFQYGYTGYMSLRKQGFSKKAAFLLAQNFMISSDALGRNFWRVVRVGDYMMVNHCVMRATDIRRLFDGEATFRQTVMKGSRGYIKPYNELDSDHSRIDLAGLERLSRFPIYRGMDYDFRQNWASYISDINPDDGFVMGDRERRVYRDGDRFDDEYGLTLMNQWVQIINRG